MDELWHIYTDGKNIELRRRGFPAFHITQIVYKTNTQKLRGSLLQHFDHIQYIEIDGFYNDGAEIKLILPSNIVKLEVVDK